MELMTQQIKYKEARMILLQYLRQVAAEKKITHAHIAEKTGFSRNNVSRMLMGRYSPSLENFIKLAEVIDVYIFIIDKQEDNDLVNIMKHRWGNLFIQ
ncbi:MAG: XRE family transcriptional regulator [Candidatus Moranbacteria bacterium]|nr:XRE family transcriptional regulator [Candidatus Moranbacteria bacterium]